MDTNVSRVLRLALLSWGLFTFFVMLLYPQDMALAVEISAALVNLAVITFVFVLFRKVITEEYLLLYSILPSFGIYLAVIVTSTSIDKALYLVIYMVYYLIGVGILLVPKEDNDRGYYRAVLYFLPTILVTVLTKSEELLLVTLLGLPLVVLLTTKETLIQEITGFNVLSMSIGVLSILELNLLPPSSSPLSHPRPLIGILSILFQQGIYSISGLIIWKYLPGKGSERLGLQ